MHTKEEKMQAFGRFLDVLDALRANCPWDKKQTNESLRPNTIEETYELCDALIKNDVHDICKELGDVLLHICFYAKIAEEKGQFDMADVCNALTRKMITRHPHVYHPSQIDAEDPKPLPFVPEEDDNYSKESRREGEEKTPTLLHSLDKKSSPAAAEPVEAQPTPSLPISLDKNISVGQVLENWEQIKLKEKDGNESVLSGVPQALPSLIKAYRIQDKARNVGFDWEDRQEVWKKVREELDELEVELRKEDRENATKELGDFLFSVINAARLSKLNPDNALEMTNRKFIDRFNYIEDHSIKIGKPLKDMSLEEMDKLWEEAKKVLNN
jgi:XTP/dITP diphosphohydrolase